MTAATAAQYINGLYVVMYGRVADNVGYDYWLGTQNLTAAQASATPISPAAEQQLAEAFLNTQSTYFNSQYGSLSDTAFILKLYQNMGGNTTGVSGNDLSYWQGKLTAANGNRADLAAEFTNDFISYNGTDPAGLVRQASFMNSIAVSQAWVGASATNSFMDATSTDSPAFAAQQAILTGMNNTSGALVTALGQINGAVVSQSLTGVVGNPSGAAVFTLTDGVDALGSGAFVSGEPTGNSQIYGTINVNGYTAATFSTGDVISAIGQNNTITLVDNSTYIGYYTAPTATLATVSGVQTANFLSQNALTIDTSATNASHEGWTGLTQLNVSSQSGNGWADAITAAATTAISVNDTVLSNSAGTMTVTGGSTVVINEANGAFTAGGINVVGGTGTTSVSVTQTKTTGTYQSVTVTDANSTAATPTAGTITSVTLNGLTGATINDNALATLSVSNSGVGTVVNINEGTFATPATTLALTLDADKGLTLIDNGHDYTTVNLTSLSTSVVNSLDATKLTTLTVGGAGAVTFDPAAITSTKVTTIDASANTGGVTLTDNWGSAAITGGAGNDIVTLGTNVVVKGAITLGAGNNQLLTDVGLTASIGSTGSVDGGVGGTNTISAALVNAGNSGHITDFQIVDVSAYGSGAGFGALDTALMGSPVSGVSINQAATSGVATILNLTDAATVSSAVDGFLSSLVVTHASGAGTLAVTLNDLAPAAIGTGLNLTSTGDTSVTITDVGTHGVGIVNLSETDNHLTTVTVTSSVQADITVHTDTVPGVLTADVASSLTTIDASATTGGVVISAGADDAHGAHNVTYTGLTILGGSGGDTITNDALQGVITEGATLATKVNTLNLTAGGAVNDQASAGADVIHLNGADHNSTANLGSGTGVVVTTVDDTAAHTTVDTVQFGAGTATVTDNLTYWAAATAQSANTNGNLLALTGGLHNETVQFNAAIVNPVGALGAATSVASSQTFDQAVFHGEAGTANTVTWFQYAGSTYIEDSGAAAGTADNTVIKVTGLVDLSHATVASGHLTFA